MKPLYRQTCINGHPATLTPDNRKPWRCGDPECEYFEGADDTAYGEDTDRPLNRDHFRLELAELINKYGLEHESNTPDYIVAEFMVQSLDAFNLAAQQRAKWYEK
jgi:hypothetical protein